MARLMAARTPEDAEELLREYERREAEGPDFMRVRPKSVFDDAPAVSLLDDLELSGSSGALRRRWGLGSSK